jgi:hypothetical protein
MNRFKKEMISSDSLGDKLKNYSEEVILFKLVLIQKLMRYKK